MSLQLTFAIAVVTVMLAGCATTSTAPAPISDAALSRLAGGSYAIDPSAAEITFSVAPLGVGRVEGEFQHFSAQLDLEDSVSGRARLKANVTTQSVYLANTQYRDMVTSPAWFDVDQYPTAHFDGVLLGWEADGTGTVRGKMTVRGVTRDEEMRLSLTCDGVPACPAAAVGFVGELTLSRSAYGMTALRGLISDGVTLNVRGQLAVAALTRPG